MATHFPADTAALSSILGTAAGGDVIKLAAGATYGNITRGTKNYGSFVTIENADPENPATCGYFFLSSVQYLKFDGLILAPGSISAGDGLIDMSSCNHITITNCRLLGAGDLSSSYSYGGVHGLNSDNIEVSYTEITETQYLMVFQQCDGLTFFGNYLHYWNAGDAIHCQSCSDIVVDEHYITRPYFDGSDVHYDMFQTDDSGSPTYCFNVTTRKNFLSSTQPGQTFKGYWTQSLFMPTNAGVTVATDNVVFNGHTHGLTIGGTGFGTGAVTANNNTILQNRYSIGATSNHPFIILYDLTTGPHSASNNVAWQVDTSDNVVGTLTKTNNGLFDYTTYGTHFPNIAHDGEDDFDNLRAAGGSSIRTNSQGSVYTRNTDYPAGYLLAQGITPDPEDPGPDTTLTTAGRVLVGGGRAIRTGRLKPWRHHLPIVAELRRRHFFNKRIIVTTPTRLREAPRPKLIVPPAHMLPRGPGTGLRLVP